MYCVYIYTHRCMYMYIIYFQEARISNGPKPSKAQSVLFCFPSTRTLSKIIRRVFVTSKHAWGNLPCADVAANALVTCQLSIGFTTRDAFWMFWVTLQYLQFNTLLSQRSRILTYILPWLSACNNLLWYVIHLWFWAAFLLQQSIGIDRQQKVMVAAFSLCPG